MTATPRPKTVRLDGTKTAQTIRAEVTLAVQAMKEAGHRSPGLVAVLVGGDPASQVYVAAKAKACEEAGLVGAVRRLPAATSEAELLALLDDLNADPAVDGILVQLPLPRHFDERRILEHVAPEKDVDGFHSANVGRLWLDEEGFAPATPSGVIELLKRYDIPMSGRQAVIVGRSTIVGKPMAALLLRENATVTICHSRTQDLEGVCRRADILVAAIGRPAFLGADAVKPGAVVIDVGINQVSDRAWVERLFPGKTKRLESFDRRGSTLVGDVDYAAVAPIASAITPVPGGVGPLTVAMLLVNTLTSARRRLGLSGDASSIGS